MIKTIQALTALLFIGSSLMAQTQLAGTVTDQSGERLIGANVFIRDSYDGASTDANGHYSFATSQIGQVVLVVTYIGFVEKQELITLDEGSR